MPTAQRERVGRRIHFGGRIEALARHRCEVGRAAARRRQVDRRPGGLCIDRQRLTKNLAVLVKISAPYPNAAQAQIGNRRRTTHRLHPEGLARRLTRVGPDRQRLRRVEDQLPIDEQHIDGGCIGRAQLARRHHRRLHRRLDVGQPRRLHLRISAAIGLARNAHEEALARGTHLQRKVERLRGGRPALGHRHRSAAIAGVEHRAARLRRRARQRRHPGHRVIDQLQRVRHRIELRFELDYAA